MASIPLLCKICPRQPEFSDQSHLLTHVSSKGHLSHYFKGQVCGRQDANVRQRVQEYDEWYERYNIAQLLAQRMASKGTRKENRSDHNKTKSMKNKPRQRKKRVDPPHSPSPLPDLSTPKIEDPLDPQLSQSSMKHMNRSEQAFAPSHFAMVPAEGAYIAHMSDWQNDAGSISHPDSDTRAYQAHESTFQSSAQDVDGDLSYFRMLLQSPSFKTRLDAKAEASDETSRGNQGEDSSPCGDLNGRKPKPRTRKEEGSDLYKSPVLKGIKWPGMSLFDSADTDAQRQRNQKKESFILQQMESNSVAVEPMERIYWPEGTLKKARVITGNVESSPISEPSPVFKRRRTKIPKQRVVLGDLDPNEPVIHQRRVRPTAKAHAKSSRGKNTQPGMKRNHRGNGTEWGDPENIDRALNAIVKSGLYTYSTFGNLEESDDDGEELAGEPRIFNRDTPTRSRARRPREMANARGSNTNIESAIMAAPNGISSLNRTFEMPAFRPHSQNVPPQNERATQRYFMVAGGGQPQFFTSMPPQMDFGGMVGPMYLGATPNPLNPSFQPRRQHPQQHNTKASHSDTTSHPARSAGGMQRHHSDFAEFDNGE